jgi:predicted nucleic acid-binding protein
LTIVEFAHGIERAKTPEQRARREALLRDIRAAMTVHPPLDEIAERAGAIAGRQSARGIDIPFADLLIGATALHHGAAVVTENLRHFQMIPNLEVRQL